MRLMVFCEAAADHETVRVLLDRVLVEEGPPWVADLADNLESLRQWHTDGRAPYFDIHRLKDYLLRELSQTLGFDPRDHAYRLQDGDKSGERNAKRVLSHLMQRDPERERVDLTETALSDLRRRGGLSGLQSFLDDVRRVLNRAVTQP